MDIFLEGGGGNSCVWSKPNIKCFLFFFLIGGARYLVQKKKVLVNEKKRRWWNGEIWTYVFFSMSNPVRTETKCFHHRLAWR